MNYYSIRMLVKVDSMRKWVCRKQVIAMGKDMW